MAASGPLVRVAQRSGGPGLAEDSGALVLRSPAPCQWRIYQPEGKAPWLRVSPDSAEGGPLCLDLTNPGQLPQLAPEEDASGQYWQMTPQMGCETTEDGASMRCLLGYKLHAMWTGEERVLTAVGETAELKPDGDEGQIWEIVDEEGNPWLQPATVEPELAVCDLEVQEPEIIACEFRPAEEPLELIPAEAVMICGGFAEAEAGGPAELLEQVRAEAEAQAQAQGWNGVFTHYEPVKTRTQVVAGTNHFCKVRVGEDVYAHIKVYEPLPGEGPAQLTSVAVPVGIDDEL